MADYGTLTQMRDYLTDGYWNGRRKFFDVSSSGLNGVIKYNVTSHAQDAGGLTAPRANLVRDAFKYLGNITGINFQETTAKSGNGVIYFGDGGSNGGSSGDYGTDRNGHIGYSFITIAKNLSGGSSASNNYVTEVILHEIGHSLGLGHQGPYNGSYGSKLFANDTTQYSVMSYYSQGSSYNPASFAYLQSMMSVDLLALDELYSKQSYSGHKFGTSQAFTGNTTYGFNTNISTATDPYLSRLAANGDENAYTIADGGGKDTFDFSGWSANQTIDLRPSNANATRPSISDIGGLIGNLTLAVGTIIENVIGGSGNDTIYGNSVNNVLKGAAGNDKLYGGAGNDLVYGGAGTDKVYGDDGNDGIRGDAGNDYVYGGAGNDRVYGDDGEDQLYGGSGNDTLDGGAGNDILKGEAGADTIRGGAGDDIIYGNSGDVFWYANRKPVDVGGPGRDTFIVEAGSSFRTSGLNWYGLEVFKGAEKADYVRGQGTTNFELSGGGGNDTLIGGSGNDTLDGGDGADRLEGGGGGDYLYAGIDVGRDVFVFRSLSDSGLASSTQDKIYQFDSEEDVIDLSTMDANTNVAGNQAFSFSTTGAAPNAIWLTNSLGSFDIYGDVNGDAKMDFSIFVASAGTLLVSDFIL